MDYEKEIRQLEEKISELDNNFKSHKPISGEFNEKDPISGMYNHTYEYGGDNYNRAYKYFRDNFAGKLSTLKSEQLDYLYENHKSLPYDITDGNNVKNVSAKYGDEDYEKAYKQQKQLYDLNRTYYKKLPIMYRDYLPTNADYDERYQELKNDILNQEINGSTFRKFRESVFAEIDNDKTIDVSFENTFYNEIQETMKQLQKEHEIEIYDYNNSVTKLQDELAQLKHDKVDQKVIDEATTKFKAAEVDRDNKMALSNSSFNAKMDIYKQALQYQNQLLNLMNRYENKETLLEGIANSKIDSAYSNYDDDANYDYIYNKCKNQIYGLAPQIYIKDEEKTTDKYVENEQEQVSQETVNKPADSVFESASFDDKVNEEDQKKEQMRRFAADINMINQKRAEQQAQSTKNELNKAGNSYVGGKHFKPNLTDSEYIVFKKGGYLHIVGNFTSDWVTEHYSELLEGMNIDDVQGIKLWNKLEYGVTSLPGFDVKVKVSKDDRLKLFGEVDEIRYYNCFTNDKKKGNRRSKTGGEPVGGKSNDTEKIASGATEKISKDKKGKRVKKRKKAKKSLIQKFKELSKGKKALIIVALVALGVIAVSGAIQFGPAVIASIQHLMNPDNVNTVSSTVQHIAPNINYSDIATNVSNAAQNASTAVNDVVNNVTSSVDFSNLGGAGHQVFSNAYDAVRGVNDLVSNQWFSGNPVDVFNTATHEFLHLTQEQLNNPDVLSQLAQDPNNALLFGNSVNDPSGFVHLSDVIGNVVKHGAGMIR